MMHIYVLSLLTELWNMLFVIYIFCIDILHVAEKTDVAQDMKGSKLCLFNLPPKISLCLHTLAQLHEL